MNERVERSQIRSTEKGVIQIFGCVIRSWLDVSCADLLFSEISLRMSRILLFLLVLAIFAVSGCSTKQIRAGSHVKRHMVRKYGYIDAKGTVVIPPQFDSVGNFSEGLAAVLVWHKWGYINRNGSMIIQPIFEQANDFSGGLALVDAGDSESCYIDKTGKVVIKFKRPLVTCGRFSEGVAAVAFGRNADGDPCNYGYISRDGKLVIRSDFDLAGDFSNGIALIADRKGWAIINSAGCVISRISCSIAYFADDISDGLIPVEIGDKYGYVDTTGKIAIKPKYDRVSDFCQERAAVQVDGEGRTFGNWGCIDKSGLMIAAPQYYSVGIFSDGLAVVRDSGSLRYGYIDRTGKLVIKPIFREAKNFSNGLALVQIGEWNWSYINKQGKVIITAIQHPGSLAPGSLYLDCYPWEFTEGRAPCAMVRKETYDEAVHRLIDERREEIEDEREFN